MAARPPPQQLPARVEELLRWWTPRMQQVLGRAYRSTLIHGSVAHGDFQTGWSDVDVCVIHRRPQTDETTRALRALQEETDARFLATDGSGWLSGQTIDAIYLAVPSQEGFAPGSLDCFDQLSLSACALVVDGAAFELPRPTRRDLALRLAAFLDEAAHPPEDASAIWYAAMIQLLARATAFWHEGTLLPKTEALERAVRQGGPEAEAYALAADIRRAGSAAAGAHAVALRRAYEIVAPSALSELTSYL